MHPCARALEKVSPSHAPSKPPLKCSATSQLSNALNSRDVAMPPIRRPTCMGGGAWHGMTWVNHTHIGGRSWWC